MAGRTFPDSLAPEIVGPNDGSLALDLGSALPSLSQPTSVAPDLRTVLPGISLCVTLSPNQPPENLNNHNFENVLRELPHALKEADFVFIAEVTSAGPNPIDLPYQAGLGGPPHQEYQYAFMRRDVFKGDPNALNGRARLVHAFPAGIGNDRAGRLALQTGDRIIVLGALSASGGLQCGSVLPATSEKISYVMALLAQKLKQS